jgi:hypothetical protein
MRMLPSATRPPEGRFSLLEPPQVLQLVAVSGTMQAQAFLAGKRRSLSLPGRIAGQNALAPVWLVCGRPAGDWVHLAN